MDWNDIPEELLHLILSNIFAKDRINFSLVSRSWNRVVEASSYLFSPCLMFNQRSNNHLWKFFQHKTSFNMHFPKLQKAVVRFSNHGWLLMTSSDDDRTLFFFDPFYNQTIKLPPIPGDTNYSTICFFHPPTSPHCIIVGILSITCNGPHHDVEIGVLKHGEDKWNNTVFFDRNHSFTVSLGPPIMHDGKILFLDKQGNVAVFDMSDEEWSLEIFSRCLNKRRSRKNIKEHFLIKPKGDETIFAVFVMHNERKTRVFRLMDKYRWKLVEDLGKMVFYLSETSSLGYTTDTKSVANKIFFPKFYDNNVVFYCMETQNYHSFESGSDYSSNNCYDFKRFKFATWVMPTPLFPQHSKDLIWCPQMDEIAIE